MKTRSFEERALLRALAWYRVQDYLPTLIELEMIAEAPTIAQALRALQSEGVCQMLDGRVCFPQDAHLQTLHDERERVFARKWAHARLLVSFIRWIPSIRFCALANTTALMHARDEADIDFFIVVRTGSLWLTRIVLGGVAWLFRKRPGERFAERDAWCFSFLMDDHDLSLKRFALAEGDPYLKAWVIRLVPLLDDGVGADLWRANAWAWNHRAVQAPWIAWQTIPSRRGLVPSFMQRGERIAYRIQQRFGSKELKKQARTGQTHVVMDDHVCKTHVEDRRAWYRETYEALLRERGIE